MKNLTKAKEATKSKAEKAGDMAKTAADKGLYVVDPDRIGAGPPQEGKYTESKKSYFVRKYMELHSARSISVLAPVEQEQDV